MSPIGILAAPTNDAVSSTNASGGWPSGALGMCTLPEVTGVKSALRGVTKAMRKDPSRMGAAERGVGNISRNTDESGWVSDVA